MLNKTGVKFSIAYALIVVAELTTRLIPSLQEFNYITKPSIVISLLIYFVVQGKLLDTRLRLLAIGALLFSVFGDVALMFESINSSYFTVGLIAFLIAHLLYISVFLKHRNSSKKPFGFIALLLLYALALFLIMRDRLGDMMVPVVVYMLVILTMATTAFLRQKRVNTESFNWVFVGAVFFLISDSILALDKFHEPIMLSSVSIMLTYALAQYCIIIGLLKLKP